MTLSAIPPFTNPSSRVGYSKQLRLEMFFFLLEFASGISFEFLPVALKQFMNANDGVM